MSNAFAEIVTFRMTVADASDGAIRVLTDAQRFGLDLVSLDLQPAQSRRHAGEGEADLTIVLSAGRPIDTDLLATRFVRHPCVLRVHVGRANSTGIDDAVTIAA